jgi:hypothetical protein
VVTSEVQRNFTAANKAIMKIKVMNTQLVQEAFDLFVETMPLETMPLNNETSFVWHDLYSKECKIFDLLGRMTDDEKNEYRKKVNLVA